MMIPVQTKTVDVATQTKSFEELVKEHMKEKLPEDIFELPEDAYDPVTYEQLTTPMTTYCGHTFNRDTIVKIGKKNINSDKTFDCPICKSKIPFKSMYSVRVLKETVEKTKEKFNFLKNLSFNE